MHFSLALGSMIVVYAILWSEEMWVMSSNRFLNKGLSGLPESRWNGPARGSGRETARPQESGGGTSFVMGGGGARTYRGKKTRSQADDPSRAQDSKTDRRMRKESSRDREAQERSLLGYLNSKEGNKIIVGVAMYGVAILLLVILLSAFFSGGENEGFYSGMDSVEYSVFD